MIFGFRDGVGSEYYFRDEDVLVVHLYCRGEALREAEIHLKGGQRIVLLSEEQGHQVIEQMRQAETA